jgi:hypothetical protein
MKLTHFSTLRAARSFCRAIWSNMPRFHENRENERGLSYPDSSFTMTSGIFGAKLASGWFLVGAYAMAQNGLMRGFAVDLAPIRVNCCLQDPRRLRC